MINNSKLTPSTSIWSDHLKGPEKLKNWQLIEKLQTLKSIEKLPQLTNHQLQTPQTDQLKITTDESLPPGRFFPIRQQNSSLLTILSNFKYHPSLMRPQKKDYFFVQKSSMS
jgi:hypothetical protein